MNLVIVYASGGGNTRETAECAAAGAREAGAEVDLYNVYMLDASILLEADAILAGEPTYGDGDHHADFIPFDRGMAELLAPARKLAAVPAAAFVGCDRAYRNFGRAIELIEDRLVECGAVIVQQGLKIELKHNDHSRAFTRSWAADFVRRTRGELAMQAYRPAMTREQADAVMGIVR
jgi:flavodoxin I